VSQRTLLSQLSSSSSALLLVEMGGPQWREIDVSFRGLDLSEPSDPCNLSSPSWIWKQNTDLPFIFNIMCIGL